MFRPNYRISGPIAKALMRIERDRQVVAMLPLSVPLLDSLRHSARLRSTHLSTQIEGNRLTPDQVQAVVESGGRFPGRERDESEVRHYYAALEFVERQAKRNRSFNEREIRTIHGLVMTGKERPTPYRDGQNVIREARSGRTVYLPPEAKDVPRLMKEMVKWMNGSIEADDPPLPIIAGLAHYQLATIHPYFDGNGRTARLLTNLLLHRHGYGLNGIYSLEEYYASHLNEYYSSLATGESHNYYMGRAAADVTPFLAYFCNGMAEAFASVRTKAEEAHRGGFVDQSPSLRLISPQQRQSLGLFLRSRTVTAKEIATYFQLSPRRASLLCARWMKDGFLVVHNPSTRARSYRLADEYERLVTKPTVR